jgi:D-amino-acid dehydrogenase
MRADVIVLGAGIVGVSVAVHLQKRGRAVLLVDRRPPGEGASFGNAGLIQREGVSPYPFPRDLGSLWRYALNKTADAYYHPSALPKLLPFLFQYWRHSGPKRHAEIVKLYAPLIERCVLEHEALAREAGATQLLRPNGWMKVFRSQAALEKRLAEAETTKRAFDVGYAALGPGELAAKEPHLLGKFAGALHFTDPVAVSDPHALTLAYVELFERLGGAMAVGDAATLDGESGGWRVTTARGRAEAREVVVALGAWADVVTTRLGYRLPLAVKRGYHMHYRAAGNAVLNHTILEPESGFALAPMAQGIRLTTGAEFADREAPKTPVQLERAEPSAKALFPLAQRIDAEPWMGVRPVTADMMPVIGPAPRHRGLWFAFGHGHHGLTLGPVTGRLIAEMMTGEPPFIDPKPYGAERF